jgi:hypothetical protein
MMAGHSKMPQRQEAFLTALLSQPTILLAAKAAGISEATATRWLKDPDFQARYAEAKRQAFGEVLAFLQQSMLGAVATLRSVMLDAQSKPTTRVMAAGKLLELAFRAHELYTLEARIAALEAAQGAQR